MKHLYFLFMFFVSISVFSQHTFSIVAVDPNTGEIGSAGATCISAEDGALAISDIVLGVGAIHTQSFYLPANQNNARIRMEAGDSPQEIIDWLIANDAQGNPSQRQYGVVDLNNNNPRSAAFTGEDCFEEFLHITGPNYSIQGNILISEEVVTDMETAFLETEGTLADKLMAALQGAKRPGADSRCLDFGISSASAFLRVANPSDTDSSYGNLSLDLNVWITSEVFEPIDALQDAYDATLSTNNPQSTESNITLFPNPADKTVTLQSTGAMITSYTVADVNGKIVTQREIKSPQNVLYFDVLQYTDGIYFVETFENGTSISVERLVVSKK
ncbi:DUF1028 domain-containing protein [Marixanthomonas ophiurae]|uniref:DUF1028 domain-containing protein n=1 Tax=Marixanthomonas ophiurae TaxID=387659 RepID=A0A3E1QDC6_9FLAO|nr:DUF1028 domain-containing protein [Marixanthomonas ophiurae]RFN60159.1 DUF1028 domain-containing protein [Marixanthomonas ophiurae]